MPDVFNRHGFGPSVAVKQPSSCSWVDHLRFGSTTSDWVALLGLAFASPPFQKNLGSPLIVTRRLIKQKARHHPALSNPVLCAIRRSPSGVFPHLLMLGKTLPQVAAKAVV